MKRILYSCLLFVSLCFTGSLNAQLANFTISPNVQCYNAANSYTADAITLAQSPTAVTYSWAIATSGTCAPSFTPVLGGAPSNSVINMSFGCCGIYTVTCFAFNGANILVNTIIQTGTIICPGGASVTASPTVVCIGSPVTFSALGAATFTSVTWSGSPSTATNAILTPSVNTCMTYTATTAQGCTVTPPASACVSVQAITATVSPASQTMCAGSPVNFTVATSIITGTTVTPGTTITAYQWFDPGNFPLVSTTTTATANAIGGNYIAVVTHTGAAGTCTVQAPAAVVIGTSIPVSITPSSFSICPNGCLTLTAVSIQTASSSYTWTQNAGFPTTFTGNPAVRCPGPGTLPRSYTLDVDYFGCPGSATITIGLLTLTPTITSSSGLSTCAGNALTLTASGGVTYTFTALNGPVPTPPGTVIAKPQNTTSVVSYTPTFSQLPIQFCISTASTGCTGSTCITVTERTLVPILTASSPSVCPGTTFTLTSTTNGTNVGTGATYTFVSPFTPTLISGSLSNTVAYLPSSTVFPQTYTVLVDSAGCQGTAQTTVNLRTLSTTLTASSPSVCSASQFTLYASGGANTSYTFFAPYAVLPSTVSPASIQTGTQTFAEHTPTSTPQLPHTYTVVADSAGCTGTASFTVGLLDLGPTLTLTASSPSVCPGTQFTLSALGAVNYTFIAPPSTILSAGANKTVTPTFVGPNTTYTIVGDSTTCIGSKTITIRELKLKPGIALSPTLVCKGMPVTVSATSVGVGPTTSYTFFSAVPPALPSVLSSIPGSFSTTTNPTVVTVYSVRVDSAGCTGSFIFPTATISLRPDLTLTTSVSSASVCPGLTATLSVVAPTTALSYTYTWSQINGSVTTLAPINTATSVTNPITNSSYSVHVLDSLGCIGDASITVGIDPNLSFPIVLSSSGSTICAGQTVTLTATSTVQTIGTVIYTWSPVVGLNTLSGITPSVIANPSVTTVYNVIADNGFGCVAQNTISVPVGQYPNFTASPPAINGQSVCAGFNATITAFGANSYTWTGSTFTNAIVQQSISVGPGTYSLLGSNGGGCTSTLAVSIGTLGPLNINIAQSSLTTCITNNFPKFSKPVQLTASGAGTYVWFPYNPSVMTFSLGPQTIVRPVATTVFTVVGSTAICSGKGTVAVNVIPQFTMDVVKKDPAICLGDSIKLSIVNIGTLAVGPVSALTYSWTEALNAPPISITNYFTPTVQVFPSNTTTYSVEVRDSRECISFPKLVTVTVLPRPVTAIAIPTINNVPTNTVCFVGLNPGALDITINLIGNNMNTGLQFGVVPTYTWLSPYAPKYNSILTPANVNGVIVNAPIRELNNSPIATYTLISGYSGVDGCKRYDTVSVRVVDCRPVRSIKFTTAEPNDTICARKCITYQNLTDTMAGGPQKLLWTFQGGSPATSTLTIPTVCYNFPGKYNVILRVENPYPVVNSGGGTPGSTLSIGSLGFVKVVDIPNVTIVSPGQVRSDTIVRFGQSVELNASGANSYLWEPAYNISSITKPNVKVNPVRTTQYILTGYNSRSCASSDTINVIIVDDCGEMYVPNAFTPNNDGANDVLYVRGICLQSLTFMVFNRWGEKVFETTDQKIGWDGTYKGEDMNTGVFVYRLEGKTYDNKAFSSKGNVTLIR